MTEEKNIKIPPGWRLIEQRIDGEMFHNIKKNLVVISSIGKELDGKTWQHVSVSHKKRVPNYNEMNYVKRFFIGEDEYAISIWPPKDKHVNIHPNCLHLWHCLDEYPLPDFTHGLKMI